MGKVANAAHCPFIASASPKFFDCDSVEQLESLKNLDGVLSHPRYSKWNELRDKEEAAYIGLTLPRYVVRQPWDPDSNPCDVLNFKEDAQGDSKKYLWGNTAYLLGRNLVKSFEQSGWCQSIRGPKGGGLVTGLPVDTFTLRGQKMIQAPVEIAIPDYREFEFARNGFIPLVYRKGSGEATFFSTQSIKRAKKFKDPKDSENSQLVTNLAYTFSITRLAHYIKSIMRDNIGSTADAGYVQRQIDVVAVGLRHHGGQPGRPHAAALPVQGHQRRGGVAPGRDRLVRLQGGRPAAHPVRRPQCGADAGVSPGMTGRPS